MIRWFVAALLFVMLGLLPALDAEKGGIQLAQFGGDDVQHGMVDGRISLHVVDQQAILAVWLRPILKFTDPPHHFYDMDLPATSFAGVATKVSFPEDVQPRFVSAWSANLGTQLLHDLSIYDDGPLTLTRTVALGADALATTAILNYMACSADACRPAVIGLQVPIVLPSAVEVGLQPLAADQIR